MLLVRQMEAASVEGLESARPDGGSPEHQVVPCVACGGTRLRILLSAAEVRAEQGWLERFHAIRREPAPGTGRVGAADEPAKDRTRFTQDEPTNVVSCTACGTVLRDPQPSCALLARTYAQDEYGRTTLERLARNQRAFFAAKLVQIEALLRELAPGARVIEVGSFVGGFLEEARKRRWRATGVDVGFETTEFTRAAGHRVLRGDLGELDLPADHDAIFVWSTFDQLCDPAGFLARASSLLRPRGLLVLRVPNGRFETACLELRGLARSLRRRHRVLCAQAYNNFLSFPYLAGYTPESLCGMLDDHGFVCEATLGDTIVTLADDETAAAAVVEEARYRRAVLRACRAARKTTGLLFHPWVDVIARRRAAG